MPLQLLSEFVGHSSLASTQIYVYADTEMKRLAIEKSSQAMKENISTKPAWQIDEEMIRKPYGFRVKTYSDIIYINNSRNYDVMVASK